MAYSRLSGGTRVTRGLPSWEGWRGAPGWVLSLEVVSARGWAETPNTAKQKYRSNPVSRIDGHMMQGIVHLMYSHRGVRLSWHLVRQELVAHHQPVISYPLDSLLSTGTRPPHPSGLIFAFYLPQLRMMAGYTVTLSFMS